MMKYESLRELATILVYFVTPWKTNMDPENHWLVEENTLPAGHCQGLCLFSGV